MDIGETLEWVITDTESYLTILKQGTPQIRRAQMQLQKSKYLYSIIESIINEWDIEETWV
jgi:hypothetical protein